MKRIYLPNNKGIVFVDDEDFAWASQFRWHLSSWGYAIRAVIVNGKHTTLRMHREIFRAREQDHVDHINRNKLDNRKENLRIATKNQNAWNKGLQSNNSTGVKGVSFHKDSGKYVARIMMFKKSLWLGRFNSIQEAKVRVEKEDIRLRGEFSVLS